MADDTGVGIIALRPDRDGRIAGYEGLAAVREAFGEYLIDWHLPPEGTPTQRGRGRLHGERVGPHEARELRSPAPHARRRRSDASRSRARARCADRDCSARRAPTPDIGAVLAELGITAASRSCTAGYQERESDDAALVAALGVPAVNLKLHARARRGVRERPRAHHGVPGAPAAAAPHAELLPRAPRHDRRGRAHDLGALRRARAARRRRSGLGRASSATSTTITSSAAWRCARPSRRGGGSASGP